MWLLLLAVRLLLGPFGIGEAEHWVVAAESTATTTTTTVPRVPYLHTVSQLSMTPIERLRQILEAHEISHVELTDEAILGEADACKAVLTVSLKARDPAAVPSVPELARVLGGSIHSLIARVAGVVPAPRDPRALRPITSAVIGIVLYRSRSKAVFRDVLDNAGFLSQVAGHVQALWQEVPPPLNVELAPPLPLPDAGWAMPRRLRNRAAEEAGGGPGAPGPSSGPGATQTPPPVNASASTAGNPGSSSTSSSSSWFRPLLEAWENFMSDTRTLAAAWFSSALFATMQIWTLALPTLTLAVLLLYRAFTKWSSAVVALTTTFLGSASALAADYAWWTSALLLLAGCIASLLVLSQRPMVRRSWQALVRELAQGDQPSLPEREAAGLPAADPLQQAAAAAAVSAGGSGTQFDSRMMSRPPLAAPPAFGQVNPLSAPPPWISAAEGGPPSSLQAALQNFAEQDGAAAAGPVSQTFAAQTGWPGMGASSSTVPQWLGAPGTTASPTAAPLATAPPPGLTGARSAASASPGISADELAFMCQEGRWIGLGSSLKRAAADIYLQMRSSGNANIREWFQNTWRNQDETQQVRDLWHTATLMDMRIQELIKSGGPPALQWGLMHDDMLEGGLRQLAAASEYKRTHDSALAQHMVGFRTPGDSVAPSWLLEEGRAYSTSLYKQNLRTRAPPSGNAGGGGPAQTPPAKGRGGGGRARGRKRGAAGNNT